jgi:hypothetical protein
MRQFSCVDRASHYANFRGVAIAVPKIIIPSQNIHSRGVRTRAHHRVPSIVDANHNRHDNLMYAFEASKSRSPKRDHVRACGVYGLP